MDNIFNADSLLPADMLLYYTEDIVDRVIAEKTGYRLGHVERYAGGGQSLASRNGIGVDVYPLRLDGLVCMRRPIGPFNFDKGMAWFNQAPPLPMIKGQSYDWEGLLTFTSITTQGEEGKMFCSEFSINFDRACDFVPCNPTVPAYEIAPAHLRLLPTFQTIWWLNEYYR